MEYSPQLPVLLDRIEAELKRLDLWEDEPPAAEAFQSPNPFCFEAMTMPQWLQWMFMPRMRQTLALNAPLAAACEVAPALEIYLDDTGTTGGALLDLLTEFDALMPLPVTS